MNSRGRGWSNPQEGARSTPPFSNQKKDKKSGYNPGQGERVTSPENQSSGRSSSGNRNSKKFENNYDRGAPVRRNHNNERPGSYDKNSSGVRTFSMTKTGNQASESKPQSPVAETRIDTESGTFQCTENSRDVKEGNRRDSSMEGKKKRGSSGNRGKNTSSKDSSFLKEVEDDLFAAKDDVSLVHCVGADFRMGSGIALTFREKFGSVGILLDQKADPGGVAYIKRGQRHLFYLVTKQASTDKPTNETMRKSLNSLYNKCKKLGVYKLAMPRIGCGLDGLLWEDVKEMLLEIFSDGFTITIYDLEMDYVRKPERGSKQRVQNHKMFLKDIEQGTGLLYIGCADISITDEMKSLNERYPFIDRLRQGKRYSLKLGTTFYTKVGNEIVYGLICKKSADRRLSYEHLEKAINELSGYHYDYYGIQAFEEKDDPYVMKKIDTLFRNSSVDAEFWICWPPSLEHKFPSKPKQAEENMEVDENQQLSKTDQQSGLPESNVSQKSMQPENSYNQDRRATTEVEKQMTAQSLSDGVESWETYIDAATPMVVNAPDTGKTDYSMGDQLAETSSEVDDQQWDSWNNSRSETNPDDATMNPEDYVAAEKRKSKEKKEANQSMKQKEKEDRKSAKPKSCVSEHSGDLFNADDTMCLAHCVGADFRMGSGIAIIFRQQFRSVPELLAQGVPQGGVAVISHEKRHIFYLVTKRESTEAIVFALNAGKPTYGSLEKSLCALHDKCKEMKITELAMPRIGCGLDKLEWHRVKPMIERIFSDGFSIHVYNLEKEYCETPQSNPNTRLKFEALYLKNIQRGTALICLGSEDMSITNEMKSLDEVYRFLMRLGKGRKEIGTVERIEAQPSEIVYILICKRTAKSPIDYSALDRAIKQLKKMIKKDDYTHMGIQAFADEHDPDVMTKIDTLFRYSYIPVELWMCFPPELKNLMPQSSSPMNHEGGKKSWRETPNDYQLSEMLQNVWRALDSVNSQLYKIKDTLEEAIVSVESKVELLADRNSSANSEVLEAIVNLRIEMENRFGNLEKRMDEQDIEFRNQKATIENLEQRLQRQESITRNSEASQSFGRPRRHHPKSNDGYHQHPGYGEAIPLLVPNIPSYSGPNIFCQSPMPSYQIVDNDMQQSYGYVNTNPGNYLKPNSNPIFASKTLPGERDALLRATKEVALPRGYKVTEHNDDILVYRDDLSKSILITGYSDLNKLDD